MSLGWPSFLYQRPVGCVIVSYGKMSRQSLLSLGWTFFSFLFLIPATTFCGARLDKPIMCCYPCPGPTNIPRVPVCPWRWPSRGQACPRVGWIPVSRVARPYQEIKVFYSGNGQKMILVAGMTFLRFAVHPSDSGSWLSELRVFLMGFCTRRALCCVTGNALKNDASLILSTKEG